MNFELVQEANDDVLVLVLSGELDMATVGPVKDAAATAVASGSYRCLVFDLTGLTFIDSSGLHVLAETDRKMKAAGRQVKVVSPDRNVGKIFELTGLDKVLTIVPDRGSAIALVA